MSQFWVYRQFVTIYEKSIFSYIFMTFMGKNMGVFLGLKNIFSRLVLLVVSVDIAFESGLEMSEIKVQSWLEWLKFLEKY